LHALGSFQCFFVFYMLRFDASKALSKYFSANSLLKPTRDSNRGVHSPLRPWCISPLFQISPPIFETFSDSLQNLIFFLPFPDKFLDFFIRQNKFLMTFFYPSTTNFEFPLFSSCFSTFLPLFRENYHFPLLWQFPLCFRKIHLFFTSLFCISFPPALTMMHLCITQCTYWTPLDTNTSNLYEIASNT